MHAQLQQVFIRKVLDILKIDGEDNGVAAAAQTTGVLATKHPITWGMIFALLFLMLGPLKLVGPFATATKDCDHVFRFRLATRAFLFSIGAVTIAASLGGPCWCCRLPPA